MTICTREVGVEDGCLIARGKFSGKKPGICAAKRVVSPCSVLHPPTTQIVGMGNSTRIRWRACVRLAGRARLLLIYVSIKGPNLM